MKKAFFLLVSMLMISVTALAQNVSISGTVADKNGEPLVGVSILVRGTTTGTMTDVDGTFKLDVPANSVIEVSSIGFISQSISVGQKTTFDIVLDEDAELLEGTVVVGYGTMKRTNFTGSVASYNVGEGPVSNSPRSNALEMLRGIAPGISMSQSGIAGATPSIQIRGQKSISGGSDPLIVLDGVIFKGQISDIDPTTIESMSVMKDATSLASYGSQAANGVIMITSKKGAIGKPTINFKGSVALVEQNYKVDLRDGYEYIELINARRGLEPDNTSWMSELELANLEKGEQTDWVDHVSQLGVQQDYAVNVSGGTEGMNYLIGVSNSDNTNFIKGNRVIRTTVTSRVNAKITNWLSAGLNFNWADTRDDGVRPSYSRYFSPWGEAFHEDGSPRKYIIGANQETATNPLWAIESGSVDSQLRGNASTIGGNLEVKIPWVKGLSYKLTGNYTLRNTTRRSFNHEQYYIQPTDTEFNTTTYDKYLSLASGSISESKNIGWVLDNIVTYDREFGKHYLNATLVYTRDSNLSEGNTVEGTGFQGLGNTTLGFYGLNNAETQKYDSITYTLHNDVGYLARLNYSYANKYHFNASFRRDGSSVFGYNQKWGNFPALGFAWTISDENFMKGASGWLDYLKLKASWGINGNQSIQPYGTLSRVEMGIAGGETGYFGGQPIFGQALTTLGNPSLGWERTESWNFGYEADMFKRRLHWELDAYTSKTTDQIFNRTIPVMGSGITKQSATMGQVNNWGIESSLRAGLIQNKDFRWDATVNFTINRNNLVELYGDGQDDITNNLFIGESLGAIYGYVWDGVVNEDDVEYMQKNNVTPGDIKNVDLDGDGVITPADRKILGFNKEAFRMSFMTNLSYKGWNLYAVFNGNFSGGRYGKALNNNAYMSYTEGMMYLNTVNHPYWTPENKSEIYPKPWNAQGSLYAVQNYGFVRLQDLSLSYTFGGAKIKKAGIKSLQLYATGNNLFFIAPDWKYSDPEVRSIQSQQLRRTYTFGINVRF